MSLWATLASLLPSGSRRSATAQRLLSEAYRQAFSGNATRQSAEIVLADLANFSGFYRVNGPMVAADVRAFSDGKRAVFGRIWNQLRLSQPELIALEEAARDEKLTDETEGEL